MGCIICNMLEIMGRNVPYEKCKECAQVEDTAIDEILVKAETEEICNDIAVHHPEMVKRICKIFKEAHPQDSRLWILKPRRDLSNDNNPWKPWTDKVFGFVIRAHTAIEARIIAHRNAGHENDNMLLTKDIQEPWLKSEYSTCEILAQDGRIGIVLKG